MISALSSIPFVSTLVCHTCGVIAPPVLTPTHPPHAYRADCRDCGAYIKWWSPRPPEERAQRSATYRQAAMAHKPPSPQQLALLRALGDRQPEPQSMHDASVRIG